MKKRKLLALIMSAVMLVSLAAGCTGGGGGDTSDSSPESSEKSSEESKEESSEKSSEAPESSEPEEEESGDAPGEGAWEGEITEFEFMNMSNSWKPITWGNDPVTAKITELTGVKLNCIIPNGDWEQMANVMLASGDYPELMHMDINATFNQYVAADALYAFSDLAEEYGYPNIMNGTYIPEDVINARSSGDGKLYLMPNWYSEDGFGSVGTTINVRTDLYEEYKTGDLKTMDDLYDFLVTIKEANLTTDEGIKIWPFAIAHFDKQTVGYMTNMWGNNIFDYSYFNEETQRVEMMLRNPDVVKSLQFLSRTLKEELMDPECLSFETETPFKEATAQGKYALALTSFWTMWDANSVLGDIDPNMIYKSIAPPEGDPGEAPYLGRIHKTGGSGFLATKNCPEDKLEALMRFVDYRMSDEGQILNFYGVEGETMEFIDGDHTKPALYPEAYEAKLADFEGYAHTHGVRVFDMMNNAKWNWEREQESQDRQENRKIAADYSFDGSLLNVIIIDPLTPEGILLAEIQSNIRAEFTKIIMEPDESKIPQMVADLLADYERRGIVSLEDEWTKQYVEKL